jgi:hypothetical protein
MVGVLWAGMSRVGASQTWAAITPPPSPSPDVGKPSSTVSGLAVVPSTSTSQPPVPDHRHALPIAQATGEVHCPGRATSNTGRSSDLLLGVVVGALVGGVIQMLVAWWGRWRVRAAVGKALLAELRSCFMWIAVLHDYYRELLDQKVLSDALLIDVPVSLETPLWDCAVRELSQLPQRHLARLAAAHQAIGLLRNGHAWIEAWKDRSKGELRPLDPERRQAAPFPESERLNLKRIMRMCEDLGKWNWHDKKRELQLEDLPKTVPDYLPSFSRQGGLSAERKPT